MPTAIRILKRVKFYKGLEEEFFTTDNFDDYRTYQLSDLIPEEMKNKDFFDVIIKIEANPIKE